MRLCPNCNTEMAEDLYLMGGLHGESIKLGKRLPKRITVKSAVCPECGKIELYTDDINAVKEL